jgi:hypothetical protein
VVFIPKESSTTLRNVAAEVLQIVDLPANPYSCELRSFAVEHQPQ